MTNKLACRICGLLQQEPPWGEDDHCPTYDICDCCGVEFGYGDCSPEAARSYRKQWLENGAKWKYPSKKPSNWSLELQMKDVPHKYR